ncbi:hypothetical protein LPW26_05030 [Rhodopseudomonas sp. HC1]|uniref:hypothetical protein n=1 Tax=Rhodopseudomonas infernalis TaxID=2897386 RepID=UPI001EE8A2FA|nr:hypothetical protein [Rhodopseudomonas infernalis]MCG6203988.1 hypothetical protein [Rhodopseudomonas infernalis]
MTAVTPDTTERLQGHPMAEAEMWKTYRYNGFRVIVIQQWDDPFGRRMIRIESIDDGGAHATGLFEADFLKEAEPE